MNVSIYLTDMSVLLLIHRGLMQHKTVGRYKLQCKIENK